MGSCGAWSTAGLAAAGGPRKAAAGGSGGGGSGKGRRAGKGIAEAGWAGSPNGSAGTFWTVGAPAAAAAQSSQNCRHLQARANAAQSESLQCTYLNFTGEKWVRHGWLMSTSAHAEFSLGCRWAARALPSRLNSLVSDQSSPRAAAVATWCSPAQLGSTLVGPPCRCRRNACPHRD